MCCEWSDIAVVCNLLCVRLIVIVWCACFVSLLSFDVTVVCLLFLFVLFYVGLFSFFIVLPFLLVLL